MDLEILDTYNAFDKFKIITIINNPKKGNIQKRFDGEIKDLKAAFALGINVSTKIRNIKRRFPSKKDEVPTLNELFKQLEKKKEKQRKERLKGK